MKERILNDIYKLKSFAYNNIFVKLALYLITVLFIYTVLEKIILYFIKKWKLKK